MAHTVHPPKGESAGRSIGAASRRRTASFVVACGLTVMTPPSAATGDGAGQSSPSSEPRVQLIDLSPAQSDVVNEAVALFADAGLVLPGLIVRGSSDDEVCGGRDGRHRSLEGWSEIDLCTREASAWERRVVLHELAHAWSSHGLTEERKAAFQALRGWTYWEAYDHAEWRDNGTEQAAEIVAWGVNDHAAPTVQIGHSTCAELRTGYLTLTGSQPRHGLTSLCDPPGLALS